MPGRSSRSSLAFVVFGLAMAAGVGSAQQPAPAEHEHGKGPAGKMAPPPLFEDLGSYHRAISTRSKQAQRYFDQGLRLVYGFNHDEAQRAFEQAARLDPRCGICLWGAALTLGPNINLPPIPERAAAAHAAERKALRLARRATPVERALIQALSRRYSDPPPSDPAAQKALDRAYADAMRDVAARYPDDLDVATLFAESLMDLRPWDLWTNDGKPQPGTPEIVATLERVLARDPNHPGANHYYVHAVEASPDPAKGLDAARRLEDMMPGAGHLVHMPSHIYIRTGQYEQASAANRRAIDSDRKYVQAMKPAGFYQMYVAHNSQFLWATTMMEGRSAESIRAARDTTAAVSLEMLKQMPGFDIVLTYPPLALLRFGRWEQVLLEPAPAGDFSFATAMWHYSRGFALAKLARLDEAAAEQQKLQAILAKTPADATESLNSAAELLGLASSVLSGQIAAKRGRKEEAIAVFQKAIAAENRLRYSEPPDWYYPVRHSLGAVLLANGQASEAEAVYREDLKKNPHNGWSLLGLAKSLEAQKKSEETARVTVEFERAWKGADVRPTGSEF